MADQDSSYLERIEKRGWLQPRLHGLGSGGLFACFDALKLFSELRH